MAISNLSANIYGELLPTTGDRLLLQGIVQTVSMSQVFKEWARVVISHEDRRPETTLSVLVADVNRKFPLGALVTIEVM